MAAARVGGHPSPRKLGDLVYTFNGHTDAVVAVATFVHGPAGGTRVVTGSGDKTARVWDADTGECVAVLSGHDSGVEDVATFVHAAGETRIVTGSNDKTARVWDAATGDCIATLDGHSRYVRAVATFVHAATGEHCVVTGSYDEAARVWNADTGDCVATLETGCVEAVATFVHNASGEARIITGSYDNTALVWNADIGECVVTLTGHTGCVNAVAMFVHVATFQTRIVTGSEDKTARVWNADTGDCITILQGHTSYVLAVATFVHAATAETRVVTGSEDRTARVWNADTGDCIAVLQGHTGGVYAVATFVHASTGETRVLTGSWDGTVRMWVGDEGLPPEARDAEEELVREEARAALAAAEAAQYEQDSRSLGAAVAALRRERARWAALTERHAGLRAAVARVSERLNAEPEGLPRAVLGADGTSRLERDAEAIKALQQRIAAASMAAGAAAAAEGGVDLRDLCAERHQVAQDSLARAQAQHRVLHEAAHQVDVTEAALHDAVAALQAAVTDSAVVDDGSHDGVPDDEDDDCGEDGDAAFEDLAARFLRPHDDGSGASDAAMDDTLTAARARTKAANRAVVVAAEAVASATAALPHRNLLSPEVQYGDSEIDAARERLDEATHALDEASDLMRQNAADEAALLRGQRRSTLGRLGARVAKSAARAVPVALGRWSHVSDSVHNLLAFVEAHIEQVATLADAEAAQRATQVVAKLQAVDDDIEDAEEEESRAVYELDVARRGLRRGRTTQADVDAKQSVADSAARSTRAARTARRRILAQAAALAATNFPELRHAAAELASPLSTAGVPQRDASAYENRRPLVPGARAEASGGAGGGGAVAASRGTHIVKRAELDGTPVVLKGYSLDDEHARAALEREIRFVNSVDHPAVIKVNAFAIEQHETHAMAWVELPFAEGGDLSIAVSGGADARLPPWEVQSLMRQAVCGLSALERCGIVHKDIKPANLLRTGDGRLLITDFDIAKGADDATVTGHGAGTPGYIAPEVQSGRPSSHKSDMYALGVVLFELTFGQPPRAAAGDVVHAIPPCDDASLAELLRALFARAPDARPSADEVLVHAYFRQSLTAGLVARGELVQRDSKVQAVREALASVRQRHDWAHRAPIAFTVSRDNLVPDCLSHFASLLVEGDDALRRRPQVTFAGEPGIDAGGLTTDMYRLLFAGLSRAGDGSDAAGGETVAPFMQPRHGTMLPRPDGDVEACRAVGAAMAKAVYDGRCVTAPLCPALFSFVCGVPPTMRDLEAFDPVLARGYQQTLAMAAEEVESLELDFDGLVDGGADVSVTGSNRDEYVRLAVAHELVGKRRTQLQAVRDGMMAVWGALSGEVAPLLRLLAPADWQLLVCGDPYVSAAALLAASQWRNFDADDEGRRARRWMEAAVRAMRDDELRRLCQFVTGTPRLPTGDDPLVFSAWRRSGAGAVPRAHTCSLTMDVPVNLEGEADLRRRVERALQHADGFGFE